MRTIYPGGLNKGFSLRFCIGSRVRNETPEEGRRTYRPERLEHNTKDEDNYLNTLNDKIFSSFITGI